MAWFSLSQRSHVGVRQKYLVYKTTAYYWFSLSQTSHVWVRQKYLVYKTTAYYWFSLSQSSHVGVRQKLLVYRTTALLLLNQYGSEGANGCRSFSKIILVLVFPVKMCNIVSGCVLTSFPGHHPAFLY